MIRFLILCLISITAFCAEVTTRRPIVSQVRMGSSSSYIGCSVLSLSGENDIPVSDFINTNDLNIANGNIILESPTAWNELCDKVYIFRQEASQTYNQVISNSVPWAYLDCGLEGDPQWYQSNGISTNMIYIRRGECVYFAPMSGSAKTNYTYRGLMPMDDSFRAQGSAGGADGYLLVSGVYPSQDTNILSSFKGDLYSGVGEWDMDTDDKLDFYYYRMRTWEPYENQWLNEYGNAYYGMIYMEEGPFAEQTLGPLWYDLNVDIEDPYRLVDGIGTEPFSAYIFKRTANGTGMVYFEQTRPY
jgi:hypothetical protein